MIDLQLYLNNLLPNQYARSLVLFIVLTIAFRILLTVGEKITISLTKKTKTDIDDIIVEKSSKPFTILALLVSLRISLAQLALSDFILSNFYNGIYSVLVIVIAYLAYVFADVALIRIWKSVSKKSKIDIDDSLTDIVHTFLKIILAALSFLYILEIWGFEIGPLLAGLGIAGLAVALALQPTLSNIFSGVSMVLDRSIRVGDWIVLDDGTWGTIERVGVRSTKINTFNNEQITYPNSKLADNKIYNVALPEPKSRVVVPFGVAYGSDVDKVKSLILKEIKKVSHYVSDPEPSVKFLEMADSSLNFKAFFFVDSYENRYAALDEANTRIYKALNKEGIEIPFPQMDVHVKKE